MLRRWNAGFAALLALPCLIAGCGDTLSGTTAMAPAASDAATAFTRPRLQLAADAAPIAPAVTVGAFDILDGSTDWLIDSPERINAWLPGSSRADSRRALQLRAERTNQLVRVTRRGAFDPAAFNELRVPILLAGHGAVRVEFFRGDETVAQTDAVLLHSGSELSTITVPIPFDVRAVGPVDGLALRLDGDARSYTLRGFELRLVAPGALLPDPAREPELVLVDGEARRGVGVTHDRPVEARVKVSEGGWLTWTCAEPPAVRRPGARVTLLVQVSVPAHAGGGTEVLGTPAEGGDAAVPLVARAQRIEFEGDLDEPSRWHAGRLSLKALAGQDVRVSFACTADDGGPAGCVVADVALCRPVGVGPAGRAPDAGEPASRRPDVLLITTDTHRGDHLGAAHAGVEIDTPVLDALAGRGVLFEDAFSPANVTNPAHMALMTGVHPRDIGILENVTALSDAAPTLAEAFRDAGYVTWAVVSTEHLGPRGSGLGQGFDRASWPPHVPRRAGESLDVVERWLPERDGRPLFVWLHVFDAHWKYEPPGEFDRLYYPRDGNPRDPSLPPLSVPDDVLPPDMAGLRDLAYPRAQYRAEIAYLDHELARVLDHGPLRDALTAFVGDHGESLGQHDIWFNHDGLYPDTLSVPLIVSAPGRDVSAPGRDGGGRVAAAVSPLDLGRTLLDLAGLRDTAFPGRSLPLSDERRGTDRERSGGAGTDEAARDRTGSAGAYEGGADSGRATAASAGADDAPRFALAASGISASVTWRGQHLILHGKAHRTPRMGRAVELHQTELYDLTSDPECDHDLVASRPETARTLRARLIEWLGAAQDRGWAAEPAADPDAVEGLLQLGYTGDGPGSVTQKLWIPDDCTWCRRLR